MIVNAIEIGATNLTLDTSYALSLPPELLSSQIHLRLSLNYCEVDDDCLISYSGLKSLVFEYVIINNSKFEHIMKSCCVSLEELLISGYHSFPFTNHYELHKLRRLSLSRVDVGTLFSSNFASKFPCLKDLSIIECPGCTLTNRYELHKLRRLFLCSVDVGTLFSSNFAFRFPCLKDLSIIECVGGTKIQIASSSLQTINFKPVKGAWRAEFDVPNIRHFTLTCSGLPSQLHISGGSREWEFDISIVCNRFYKSPWFRKRLTMFRSSKITLSISLSCGCVDEVYREVVGKPLVVENLVIDDVASSLCSALLIRLLGVFRPKFITHDWVTNNNVLFFKNESLDIICMRLMQQPISPSCGIPNQNMFGRFGLKKVNLEVYEKFGTEWRPFVLGAPLDASKAPENQRKVRFELIWED